MGEINWDLDYDSMSEDEIATEIVRVSGCTRKEAIKNFRWAEREVRKATNMLFAACADGKVRASGVKRWAK